MHAFWIAFGQHLKSILGFALHLCIIIILRSFCNVVIEFMENLLNTLFRIFINVKKSVWNDSIELDWFELDEMACVVLCCVCADSGQTFLHSQYLYACRFEHNDYAPNRVCNLGELNACGIFLNSKNEAYRPVYAVLFIAVHANNMDTPECGPPNWKSQYLIINWLELRWFHFNIDHYGV